jgi:hypothetical protein
MLGSINFRTYVLIAIGVGLSCYLLGTLAGDALGQQLESLGNGGLSAGLAPVIVQIIIDPLIWVLSGDILAAVVAGVLWPLAAAWLVFLIFLLAFSLLGNGLLQARDGSGLGN